MPKRSEKRDTAKAEYVARKAQGEKVSLRELAEKLGVKNATLMWPVRIAVAGKLVTPGGAVELCYILGKEEALRRLRLGLEKLA